MCFKGPVSFRVLVYPAPSLLPARKSIKGLLATLVDSSVLPSLVFAGRENTLDELLATSRAANNPLGIRLASLIVIKEHERAQGFI